MNKLESTTQTMTTLMVMGKLHVLCESRHVDTYTKGYDNELVQIEPSNYMYTGKALCGVLKPGQTLDEFRQEFIKIRTEQRYYTLKELSKAKKMDSGIIKDYAKRNEIEITHIKGLTCYKKDDFINLNN